MSLTSPGKAHRSDVVGRSVPEAPVCVAGLSSDEAARRLRVEGPNAISGAGGRSLLDMARDALREPMFMLLLLAGGIYLALGDLKEGLTLFGFVLINLSLTLLQEGRAEPALEALRDLSSPRALVIRDGIQSRIAGTDVVRGDLLKVAEGDRAPADVILIQAEALRADESILTGESVPVSKRVSTTQALFESNCDDERAILTTSRGHKQSCGLNRSSRLSSGSPSVWGCQV